MPGWIDIEGQHWLKRGVSRSSMAGVLRPLFRRAGLKTDRAAAQLLRARGVYPISDSYVWKLATGLRPMSPKMVREFAVMLRLDSVHRRLLNRAAARDFGYDIGSIHGSIQDVFEE